MQDKFSIGIIGGTGGIGKWFARLFESEGYPVRVSGRKSGPSPEETAETCEVTVVAVPIGDTIAVIEKIGPLIKRENLLMDLTSLKSAPVAAMLRASSSEVIGMHPLFGPDVPSLAGQNVILCPGRGEKWLPWLTDLLNKNKARVTTVDPQRHDEMMALIQALNHLNTFTLGLALQKSGVDPRELDRYSTPVFRAKQAIIDRVVSGNPRLYAEIIMQNPNRKKVLDLYSKSLSELKDLIEKDDTDALTRLLRR